MSCIDDSVDPGLKGVLDNGEYDVGEVLSWQGLSLSPHAGQARHHLRVDLRILQHGLNLQPLEPRDLYVLDIGLLDALPLPRHYVSHMPNCDRIVLG